MRKNQKFKTISNEAIVSVTLDMVNSLRDNPNRMGREILYAMTSIDGSLNNFDFNDSDKMAMLSMYHEVEEMLKKSKEGSEVPIVLRSDYCDKEKTLDSSNKLSEGTTVKNLIEMLTKLEQSGLVYVSGRDGTLLPLDKIVPSDNEGKNPTEYYLHSSQESRG